MDKPNCIGLIPAAGKGLRLGLPYPKELYPIIRDNKYKPVSQFVLENITTTGVEDIVFVINETKHQLIGYFGNGRRFGCHISYAVQEVDEEFGASKSPGLAHALNSAYHLTAGRVVLFGMADTIMQPKDAFCQLLAHLQTEDDLLLGLFPTRHPEKFGMVDYDPSMRVSAITDKPERTRLTHMWGCMLWSPRFTDYLHQSLEGHKASDLAQIINTAIADGFSVKGIPIQGGNYTDLGTYEEILEMDRRLRSS
jgi:glucose-1-phosphate thymidylyltransferase